MHTVMWTFETPEADRAMLIDRIRATAHTYQAVPGLIRKYYGVAADARSIVGIYLWRSKAEADAFFTDAWVAMVTDRWGAVPCRQEWETPMVVESAEQRLTPAE